MPVALHSTSLPLLVLLITVSLAYHSVVHAVEEEEVALRNDNGVLHSATAFSTPRLSASTLTLGNTTLDGATLKALLQSAQQMTTAVGVACGLYTCSVHAHCESDTVCVCSPGYRGSGTACSAINPCVESTHSCKSDGSEACLLTQPGVFQCVCGDGYVRESSAVGAACVKTTTGRLLNVREISGSTYLLPFELDHKDQFGASVAGIGDLDGE